MSSPPIRPLPFTTTVLSAPQTTLLAPQQPSTNQTGLDIRSDFDNFIDLYGQFVLVQRISLDIHCTHCWNELKGEGDPQCIWCLGRGYLSVFEKHISRKESSLNEHRQQLLTQASPGDELIEEIFWFFKWNVNIQVEDVVFEVTWTDATQTTIQHMLASYEITYSFPFRGSGGRIEYWRASALEKPIDSKIVGAHLKLIAAEQLGIPEDGILRYLATYPNVSPNPSTF